MGESMLRRRPVQRVLFLSAIFLLQNCTTSPAPVPAKSAGGPTLTAWVDGVRSDETRRELTLAALDVAVTVEGGIAATTVTAKFDNPYEEELEGDFVISMPRGSVVTGYALDIGDVMVDGVLETRYNAGEAYQRRVSRRIDPGLAEVDYSDRFQTSIYPIPEEGSRTVRIRMVTPFDPEQGYVLPMGLASQVDRVTLTVEGDVKLIELPEGVRSAAGGVSFNATLKGSLRLEEAARTRALLVSEHSGGERFFDLSMSAKPSPAQAKPLHIFWDRSVSRTDDDHEAEARLAQNLAASRGLSQVKLTLFDSGKVETLVVDADGLPQRLANVRYRGATSYAVLSSVDVEDGSDCLMFSDGRVTIDDRRDFALPCAILAVSSGPESDRAWLSYMAERSGGAFASLSGSSSAAVLARLQNLEAAVVSVTDSAGRPIEAVRLPSDSGSIRLIGPMPDGNAIQVKLAGETATRVFRTVRGAEPFDGPGALWASHRIGIVSADLPPSTLADMSRRYSVATPQTSFVVLELPEDYVDAGIAPSPSYPKEALEEYAELRAEADEEEAWERENRFDEVVELWEDEKAWWADTFDGTRTFGRGGGGGVGDGSLDRVVVTGSLIVPEPAPPQVYSADVLAADASSGMEFAATLSLSASIIEETDEEKEGSIEVAAWAPDRPYLDRLKAAGQDWEAVLDSEMKTAGGVPLFWFDIAEWHWQAGRREEARRAVEAALDLPTRNNQTLAIVAARLLRYGSHDRAIWLLERLAERETDRPQPLRTLALAHVERAKAAEAREPAISDLKRAIELLSKSATDVFPFSPDGFEIVALSEANVALARLKALGGSSNALDERLVALLDTDVRVVVEWNTPRTDIDLWVKEPKGADVGYSSPLSPWGGKLSEDITDGYGPEQYTTRKAQSGVYVVSADTFATDRSNPNGPSTITVRLFRNYGRPGQTEEVIDFEMAAEEKEQAEIGRITIQ